MPRNRNSLEESTAHLFYHLWECKDDFRGNQVVVCTTSKEGQKCFCILICQRHKLLLIPWKQKATVRLYKLTPATSKLYTLTRDFCPKNRRTCNVLGLYKIGDAADSFNSHMFRTQVHSCNLGNQLAPGIGRLLPSKSNILLLNIPGKGSSNHVFPQTPIDYQLSFMCQTSKTKWTVSTVRRPGWR